MPSQPLPRLRRSVRDVLPDWDPVRRQVVRAAQALGLATRRPRSVAPEPLLPGARLGDVKVADPKLPEDRLPKVPPPAHHLPDVPLPGWAVADGDEQRDATETAPIQPAPTAAVPVPTPVSGPLLARAVVRLGMLSMATVIGVLGVFAVGMILSRPALSNAKALVDVQLDIPEEASLPALEERSTIYDSDDNLLAVIDREISRRSIPLDRVPEHVRQAVITAEDRRFYEHDGYDVEGIGRALVANLQARGVTEGGSTITQQLAKSEVGNERTLERKVSELWYAIALEERFGKDELLERYLNQVYFGSRAYGIAAAAEEFFHANPRRLTVDQAALLASLIRSPNSADPRDKPELALQRRNAVLRGMADEGYIDEAELAELQARPLGVKESSPKRQRRQPHVVDAVERELLRTKAFGKTREERERLLYHGGLRITTTLDLQMQRDAAEAIREYLPDGAPTAAVATVDPSTGAVKAIASGLGYRDLKYDLPTQGRRQPGSAMKPFIYAAALQEGFPLKMSLSGRSPAYFDGVPGWERDCRSQDKKVCGVSNYGGSSYGQLDMPEALKRSVNTAAAQLTITLGPKRVARMARQMGVDIKAATNGIVTESIGLGGLDQGVTPLEMAGAYATFANDGKAIRPYLIAKVESRSGDVLYEAKPKAKQVLDPVVDHAMIDMMRGVVTGGTGTGAQLPSWPVAGKTGTTSSNVDAWFVGFTPTLSTAVWVGHAKGQVQMPGMTGGALPASIWRSYMGKILDGRKVQDFPAPDFAALERRMAGKSVNVPDVVRMAEAEALAALGRRKLIGQVRQEFSTAPAGTVVWQSPRAGSSAHAGETVYIGVSTGYTKPAKPKKKDKKKDREEQEDTADEDTTEEDSGGGGRGRGNKDTDDD